MSSELNDATGGSSEASRDWLSALVLQRGSGWMPRFLSFYRALARRPRPWRRQLQRKLAVTVTGAALLLALAGGPIALAEPIDSAALINVVNGEVAIQANGKCSLMEAIWNARTTQNNMKADCKAGTINGPDTVVLPAGGNFVLTNFHNEVFGPTGLPVITSAVTIDGNGATIRRSTVSGTPKFRILAVDEVGSLTLKNATIRDGYAETYDAGGGIFSKGNLVIQNSTITDNDAYYGGGIRATSATISGSRILNNEAWGPYGGAGGGISVSNLAMTDTTVAGNSAFGGEEWSSYGGGVGGGVSVGSGTISGSTISGNRATNGWDGYNNFAPIPGLGGGVFVGGDVTIANSTISNNEANYGGGVFVDGNLNLVQSTLTGNNAKIDTEEYYGYIYHAGGDGGGIYVNAANFSYYRGCGTATLRGVVVAGNTSEAQGREIWVDPAIDECAPILNADAFNVFGRGGNAGLTGMTKGATDIIPSVELAAILSPLADNGGPTQTHALPEGSPALDLAPSNSCTAAPVNGVDQRGEPRNQNGAGGATANECDAGSFELGSAPSGQAFLISPAGSGTVGAVAFAPADILKYDPSTGWSMYVDGSDVGITKNLAAFEVLNNGHILMSFAANQPIAGVGTFAPQDIARFVPTATGPNTAGSFQWAFDGSANLLTTTGEKIDALGDPGDGRVALSTTGAAAVKWPNGTVLKAQDEDALGINLGTGAWSTFFDGTAVPGLGIEDVNALWVDPSTGDLYVSIVGAFNLAGVGTPSVLGNGKDIVKLTKTPGAPGGFVPSLWWDGSAVGFPSTIDGLEMLP